MSRWGRLALGALVFGWMNAVAQPCFMDMSMSADVPATAMHGEHGGHVMEHDTADADCGHCPPGGHDGTGDCQTVSTPACEASTDVVVDGRTIKLEWDDLPDDSAALVASVDPPPGRLARVDYLPDCRTRLLPAGPPVNLLNCVFLK